MNLYRNINREKIQFDFLVNNKGIFDEEIKNLGGKLYIIPALQKVGQITYTNNLDNFFKEHKEYKIVHSHYNQVTGLILERANKANIPIRIAHSHSAGNPRNIIKRIYKDYLGSKILNNATLLIGCSDKACQWLYKQKSNEAIIIHNGIDIERFKFNIEVRKRIRDELGIKEDEIVIGHVGRFAPQKNHDFLIDIFKKYSELNQNSRLLLVGDGKLKTKIEKKIKKDKIDSKVIILNTRKDVEKIYQAMDLFLFPSLYEGLGLALIEAQIAGLPIFASNSIPSMANITNKVQFLDLKEKPEIWAKQMLKVNMNDRYDKTKKIIEAGYDIKEVVKKMEEMYINLYEKVRRLDQ